MNDPRKLQNTGSHFGAIVPQLRRHVRAMTGSRHVGDALVTDALDGIAANDSLIDPSLPPKVSLFRAYRLARPSVPSGMRLHVPASEAEAAAMARIGSLIPEAREALLLATLEGFEPSEVGAIMGLSPQSAAGLIAAAKARMADELRGRILIVEDDRLISDVLRSMIERMGHKVAGIARTSDEALARPYAQDVILADVQLADSSTGMEAVRRLAMRDGKRPVIYVTGYPERLLTGGPQPEPAFLLSKPVKLEQVRSAISQAMFFSRPRGSNSGEK